MAHLRLLPGRCRDHRLPQNLGPQGRPRRAGGGLRQGAGPVPHRQIARSGFTEKLTLDLADVVPSMAGPKRPEGRVALPAVAEGFAAAMTTEYKKAADALKRYPVENRKFRSRPWRRGDRGDHLLHQHFNPSVLIGAGLLARTPPPKDSPRSRG